LIKGEDEEPGCGIEDDYEIWASRWKEDVGLGLNLDPGAADSFQCEWAERSLACAGLDIGKLHLVRAAFSASKTSNPRIIA